MDAKTRRHEVGAAPRSGRPPARPRRVIVVGTRQNGRWKVRMSLWRYLAATAISQ
jgi:hypothetical protein